MRTRFIGIFFLFLTYFATNGQEIIFVASTDANQFVVGQYFNVTFTIENAKGTNFQPPSFSDFQILSGPNQSSQMSIINGKVSQKQSFGYTLTADRAGKYTIGKARIKIDGKYYETEEITIEGVEGTSPSAQGGVNESIAGDYFVRSELSVDRAYIGQQLTLKYVLYTTKDVRSYNFTALPDFDGFFAQEIQNYNERPVRVVENGVQYVSRVLKVISLFPQQKGIFEIEPAQLNLGIATRGSRSSFFFNTNLKPVRLLAESIRIDVIDLPDDPPLSFNGSIGHFKMSTSIDKKSLTMDDAITLTLQIRGDGDNKFVEAPNQPYTDLFDIYDPNLLKEEVLPRGDKVELTKTYEYLLLPKKSGSITFTPELTYFNLDSNQYVTIYGSEYKINVLESNSRQVAQFTEESIELPPIYTATTLKVKGKYFLYSRPYWIANGAIALSFFSLLFIKRIQVRERSVDQAVKRNSKAKKLAIQKLSKAKTYLDQGEITEFHIQLRKGILEYLSDKTNQPSAQLSKEVIKNLLKVNGLVVFESDLISLLEKGERAIYAAIKPGMDEQSYQKALYLIENIETALKK